MWKRVAIAVFAASIGVADASAQTAGSSQPPATSGQPASAGQSTAGAAGQSTSSQQPPEMAVETRPATTTFRGDTGLWFVPTGEVLPARRWSVSGYRVNFDYNQGFTDVSNWPIT